LPKVKLLTESIKKYHPEAVIHLALADERPANVALDKDFASVWSVRDLGIENWQSWAFGHTIVELATAIKPFVLERLLAQDGSRVIYMDPDTVLYSRLDDVLLQLESSSIVLTPHQTSPETSWQAVWDNEICSLKHGIYNLGFIAVSASPAGRSFAAWWRERCHRLCIDDIPNGLFTDQKWIDLVPALFPEVAIMRTPRLNVSTWNLSQRRIKRQNDQLMVNDEPLGFYHYTGFDSGAHKIMAQRYGSESPVVYEMIDWYTRMISHTESDPLSKHAWAFSSFDNGEPIEKLQRRAYRSRKDLQEAFPQPFNAKGYLQWWKTIGIKEYAENSTRAPAAISMTPKKACVWCCGKLCIIQNYLHLIWAVYGAAAKRWGGEISSGHFNNSGT